jgi:excisionase family DNA binding protein
MNRDRPDYRATSTPVAADREATPAYRVREVAELLRVHPITIYRAIAAGRLRAMRIGTRRGTFRITREAFDAYRASHATTPEEPAA